MPIAPVVTAPAVVSASSFPKMTTNGMSIMPACAPPGVIPGSVAPAPVPSAPCAPGKLLANQPATQAKAQAAVVVAGGKIGQAAAQPSAQPVPAAASAKGAKRTRVTNKTASTSAEETPLANPAADHTEDNKTPESGNWLIVAKAVRSHLKTHEVSMHCGSDALPALNLKLADLIHDAIGRAQNNGRKTIKACDF